MDIQEMENFWHEGKARITSLGRSNKELLEALELIANCASSPNVVGAARAALSAADAKGEKE